MSALNEMTIKELIAKHNELVPDTAAHIVKWHGRKDLLVEKVAGVIQAARGTLTIKSVSDALLTAINYIDEAGKPIGFTYDHVLAKVLEQFPDANTTVKCLRWYNTKLNSDPNVKMPVRPRKRTVKVDQPGQAVNLPHNGYINPETGEDVQTEPETVADPLL
jgi:hypothetical protein